MRLLFVAGSFALLASAATFACSSASPATAATADAGSSSGSTTTSSGSTTTAGSSTSSSSGSTTTTGDDDGGTEEAGTTTTTTDGGLVQGADGGAACAADPTAFAEQEPNDTAATANTLPLAAFNGGVSLTAFCGNVSTTDVDWLTFKMPAEALAFKVNVPSIIGGDLNISGTIGGNPFSISRNGSNFPSFKPGDTWVVKFDTTDTSVAYDIEFQLCDQAAQCQ